MYVFIGDSHSRQFVGVTYGVVEHLVFSRASMQGLNNTSSALRHGEVALHSLSMPRDKIAFMMFGGVDLDFSWPRQVTSGDETDFEHFTQRRIGALNSFLDKVYLNSDSAKYLKRLYLFLPQVSPLDDERFFARTSGMAGIDEKVLRDYAQRFDFTHVGRAARTKWFNDQFEASFANDDRLVIARIDNMMLGTDGIILDQFKPSDPDDHHASESTRVLWKKFITQGMEIVSPPWDYEF